MTVLRLASKAIWATPERSFPKDPFLSYPILLQFSVMWRWHLWLWWGGWWCRVYCKHGIKRSPDSDWPLCLRLGQGSICGLQTLSTKSRSGSSSLQQQQQQPYFTLLPSPLQHQATALHDHVLCATSCQSPPQTISAKRAHQSLPSSQKFRFPNPCMSFGEPD